MLHTRQQDSPGTYRLLQEAALGLGSPTDLFFFFFFCLFRAAPEAYGGSQARGPTGAAAAGPHHSHGNTGSEPHLRPTPQLMATPDP